MTMTSTNAVSSKVNGISSKSGSSVLTRPAMHASTPTAEQTATGGIARLACARLKEAGVALEPLLKKTGLTLRQIEDPEVRLRVKDQINLLNHAAGALRDNLLGFHLAQSLDLREFGLPYYVLASSESLSEALQRAHYSSIANEGILLKYVEGGDVCMRFAYVGVSGHLDRHQIEFWMVVLVRMCRELTGLRVTPTRVRLTHRRDDAGSKSEFAEFFGGDLEFGAAIDDVAFAASVGQMPIASADPYLNKILIAYAALQCEATRQSVSKHLVKSLTCRERQIVLLVAEGLSNKEICRRLGRSVGTVKIHLHNVYEKVGVNNRTALAAWQLRATKSFYC